MENGHALLPNVINFQTSKIWSDISTSEREVNDLLSSVDVSKACDIDRVVNALIKASTAAIANPFSPFINTSLSKEVFPSMCKLANVIPIFKKDDRQLKVTCHPVSLLISLSKISEKIVF